MRTAAFCKCDINLEAIVKAAISAHNATQKHKNSARQTKSNQSVKAFFKSQFAPTTLDYKAAAAEGTWALYTVKHQQSFLSNECTSHLFETLFPDSEIAKQFPSARTKTKSIIIGVLSPYAQKILLSELETQVFLSLSRCFKSQSVKTISSGHQILQRQSWCASTSS